MNRLKYLFAAFMGTFVYVFLSLTVGQNSLHSAAYLEEQKILISRQTTEIQNINNELRLELSALQNDNAVIEAYARKLDYVTPGEKLVKITGLKPAQTTLYNTGTVLHHTNPSYLNEKYCKLVSLFIGLLTFVIMFLIDFSKGRISFGKEKKPIVTGVPVYDLPQI